MGDSMKIGLSRVNCVNDQGKLQLASLMA